MMDMLVQAVTLSEGQDAVVLALIGLLAASNAGWFAFGRFLLGELRDNTKALHRVTALLEAVLAVRGRTP
jgi:hypothetical protein